MYLQGTPLDDDKQPPPNDDKQPPQMNIDTTINTDSKTDEEEGEQGNNIIKLSTTQIQTMNKNKNPHNKLIET